MSAAAGGTWWLRRDGEGRAGGLCRGKPTGCCAVRCSSPWELLNVCGRGGEEVVRQPPPRALLGLDWAPPPAPFTAPRWDGRGAWRRCCVCDPTGCTQPRPVLYLPLPPPWVGTPRPTPPSRPPAPPTRCAWAGHGRAPGQAVPHARLLRRAVHRHGHHGGLAVRPADKLVAVHHRRACADATVTNPPPPSHPPPAANSRGRLRARPAPAAAPGPGARAGWASEGGRGGRGGAGHMAWVWDGAWGGARLGAQRQRDSCSGWAGSRVSVAVYAVWPGAPASNAAALHRLSMHPALHALHIWPSPAGA